MCRVCPVDGSKHIFRKGTLLNILMAGDIMGSPGRTVFARVAGEMKRTGKADFVVANAENSAAGKGITAKIAEEIFDLSLIHI